MNIEDIKVGEKYKVLPRQTFDWCSNCDRSIEYILIKQNTNGALVYELHGKNTGEVANCRFCIKPEHLEPYVQPNKVESEKQELYGRKVNVSEELELEYNIEVVEEVETILNNLPKKINEIENNIIHQKLALKETKALIKKLTGIKDKLTKLL